MDGLSSSNNYSLSSSSSFPFVISEQLGLTWINANETNGTKFNNDSSSADSGGDDVNPDDEDLAANDTFCQKQHLIFETETQITFACFYAIIFW